MEYQEAIKYFEFKIDNYKRMISQRKKFDQSIDNSGLEEDIEFFETAVFAIKKMQQIKSEFIPEETIDDLREFFDRGCEYSGTQEIVNELVNETLKEIGSETPYGDEIALVDFECDNEISTIYEFTNLFWDKAIERILNVLSTQEIPIIS